MKMRFSMSWVIFSVFWLCKPSCWRRTTSIRFKLSGQSLKSLGVPAPGKRFLLQLEESQGADDLYHLLYLPTDWRPDASWPLVVEYPGNGGYANELGDTSDGTMEGCMMGYGLSEGRGFLWLCPPIVGQDQKHAIQWWGDIEKPRPTASLRLIKCVGIMEAIREKLS